MSTSGVNKSGNAADNTTAKLSLADILARPTISERLVGFMQEQLAQGVPEDVLHEAKRLLINQLKASVGATDHPAVLALHDWAQSSGTPVQKATALWFGSAMSAEHAAVVNGALFEVLDFNDTYIPCFMHATSGVLPAVLAAAETGGHSGHQVLTALALGMEVELACATILMPSAYTQRGFVPGGLTGAIGGAAACAVLAGLDESKTRNALSLAMCSAFGLYESVGSDGLPYLMGMTARAGLNAWQMAERGLTGPRTAIEGERGMLAAQSNESIDKVEGVLATLGKTWRIFGNTYKTVPTETITHAPIECVMEILKRANGRTVERMRFGVEPIVVKIADERRARFGNPSSELTARFDTRFCAAAAWTRGRFTLAEMREAAYTDAAILALRERVDLIPDTSFPTFDGCALEVIFSDGSKESTRVPNFLGTPGNRMSDTQLSDVFRVAAGDLLPTSAIDGILAAAWGLETAPNIQSLMTLARLG
jgi:2-methylcitrate dehydratase PrpD